VARVSVTTQPIQRLAAATALTAVTVDGDVIDTGRVALYVKNDAVTTVTVTVQTPVTVDGLAVADLAVVVPASSFRLIGPLPVGTFGQPQGDSNAGRALVDYTGTTLVGVTRAVVSL
jgi:hypothetical protein